MINQEFKQLRTQNTTQKLFYKIDRDSFVTFRIQVMRGATIETTFETQSIKWEEYPLCGHFKTIQQFINHLQRQNGYWIVPRDNVMRIIEVRDQRLPTKMIGDIKLKEIVHPETMNFQEIAQVCQKRSPELSNRDIKFIFLSLVKNLSQNKYEAGLEEKSLIDQQQKSSLFTETDISDRIKQAQEQITNLTKRIDELKFQSMEFKGPSQLQQNEKQEEVQQSISSKLNEKDQILKVPNQIQHSWKIFEGFAKISSSILSTVQAIHKKIKKQIHKVPSISNTKTNKNNFDQDKQKKKEVISKQIQHDEQIRSQYSSQIPRQQIKEEDEFLQFQNQ